MTYAIVTVIVLILDQLMKFWTTKNIPLDAMGGDCVELIPRLLHLTNVHNTGAAFSILRDARWLLVGITLIFVVVVIVLITQEIIRGDLGRWSAVLVMAGALSNAIDRALYGYVVDMFEVEFMNFAVFNIADIFITVCGILFCVYIILEKPEKRADYMVDEGENIPARARTNRVAATEADELMDDETDTRRSRAARRAKKEAMYDAIPKRGEHRSLAEEFAPADKDDPFAEWFPSEPEEAEPQSKPEEMPVAEPVAEPEKEPQKSEDDGLSFGDELDFNLDDILSEFGDD